MAASTTRVYGSDMNSCIIAGQDITDIVQTMDIGRSSSTVDVTVLRDPEEANRHSRYGGRMTFTLAYDTAFSVQIAALEAAVGTSVNFYISTVSGGIEYVGASEGKAMLLSGSHSVPEGGQTITFELAPDGSGGFSDSFDG